MKFSGILLATDIDGTLAEDGIISKANQNAIRYFTENGGLFTLATGRSFPYITEKYGETLAYNAPLIAVNGTRIVHYNTGAVLHQCPMEASFRKVLSVVRAAEQEVAVYVHTPSGAVLTSFDEKDYLKNDYLKIVFIAQKAEVIQRLKRLLIPQFLEFDFVSSWETSLEVISKKTGKGKALQFVKQYTKAKMAIGVGDYENDLSLLQAADVGIAVENAAPSLKAIADYVTVSVHENAIEHIIHHLDKFCKL